MRRAIHDATACREALLRLPKLGFGTWQLTGDACVDGVRDALDTRRR